MEKELVDVTEWKSYIYDAIVEEIIENRIYLFSDDIDDAADELCPIICDILARPSIYRTLGNDSEKLDELIRFFVVNLA